MLRDTEFDEIFDEHKTSQIGSLIEGVTPIEAEGYFKEDFSLDAEPSGELKIPQKNKEIPNQDLRLINAYFKEIGTEPLLTSTEEIEVTAKIRKCETRAKEVQRVIKRILGGRFGRDIEKTVQELKGVTDKGTNVYKTETATRRIKRLINLFEAYSRKAIRFRNRFIKSNLRLVASIAKRYIGRGVPFLDLIQEGNLELIKAVERFDYTRGYRFSTYACWWIHQAITRAIFTQTRTIRIPAYVFERSGRVQNVRFGPEKKTGRKPFPEEIAKRGNMSVESVKQVREANEKVVSLDSPVWQGEKITLMDLVPDPNSLSPDSLIAVASVPKSVDHALLVLSPREREVLKMRFGIGYKNPSTLDAVGKRFDLTRERIRQIERDALQKLKRSNSAHALKSLIEEYQ